MGLICEFTRRGLKVVTWNRVICRDRSSSQLKGVCSVKSVNIKRRQSKVGSFFYANFKILKCLKFIVKN